MLLIFCHSFSRFSRIELRTSNTSIEGKLESNAGVHATYFLTSSFTCSNCYYRSKYESDLFIKIKLISSYNITV